MKSNRQLQLDVVRLEERVRYLEFELVQKDENVIELQKTIEKIKSDDQVRELEDKVRKLEEEKIDVSRQT